MTISTTITHTTSKDSEKMITSFIKAHPEGVLSTINQKGAIQSSVVTTFHLDDYEFAFMTKKHTRKYKNLLANPLISFMTYDPFSRTEAEIEGFAQLITDEAHQKEIVATIRKAATRGRHHLSPYVTEMDDFVIFMIYPRKIHLTTYWDRGSGPEAYHEAIDFEVSMER